MREPTKEERERAKKLQLDIARKITKDTNEEPMLKTRIIAQLVPFATLAIMIIVVLIFSSILFSVGEDYEQTAYDDIELKNEVVEKPVPKKPQREGMYGISNKDINDIDDSFSVSYVGNDVTGRWRISTIESNINMLEYAVSYYKEKFKSSDEVHGIVNFNNYTTTKIITMSDEMLEVSIYGYLSGEEYDAKLLYGGDLLGQYFVYLDNGDIEKIL